MSIIPTAFAADAAANPAQQGDFSMIIVLTICMIAVYFFFMRPNNKKRKEMQKLLDNLAVGDEVLTNGGIAGRIVKLPDNKEYVLVSVSSGVVIHLVEREAAERICVRYRIDLVALFRVICTLLRLFRVDARAVYGIAVDSEPLAHIEQALLHYDGDGTVRGGADIEQEVAAL